MTVKKPHKLRDLRSALVRCWAPRWGRVGSMLGAAGPGGSALPPGSGSGLPTGPKALRPCYAMSSRLLARHRGREEVLRSGERLAPRAPENKS